MKKILLSILACVTFVLCGSPASAVTYPDFAKAKHIYGEEITAEDLEGKVVLFEYWGINCPPCIAAMPHLQELQKKYGKKGFTVIGAHSQGLTDEVEKFLKKNRITFPVYQSISIPEARCPGGLPHAVLIDHEGNVVATGQPTEMYDKVPDLVKKGSKAFKKAKAAAAKKKKAEKKKKKAEEEEAEEEESED